eukprot:14299281-Alexandrium_andersonii.AAC.1
MPGALPLGAHHAAQRAPAKPLGDLGAPWAAASTPAPRPSQVPHVATAVDGARREAPEARNPGWQ